MCVKYFVIIILVFTVLKLVVCGSSSNYNNPSLRKTLTSCISQENNSSFLNCATASLLKTLNDVSNKNIIHILPGIELISDNSTQRSAKQLNNIYLPTNSKLKVIKLLDLLLEGGTNLLSGRTLKIKLPQNDPLSVARALEEGRKIKKFLTPVMIGMGAKMMVGVLGFAIIGLFFMASKSLVVSAVAFILSVIVFLQNYVKPGTGTYFPTLGGYGGYYPGGTSYGAGTWSTNNIGGQYPYARSLNTNSNSLNQ